MKIEIFYPERNLQLDLTKASGWYFANKDLVKCEKEEATYLLITFPEQHSTDGERIIGGTPELYFAPGKASFAYITQESWDLLK